MGRFVFMLGVTSLFLGVCLAGSSNENNDSAYDYSSEEYYDDDYCQSTSCPADEEYSDCPNTYCGPLTCAEAGFPKPNCGNSSTSCQPGCICKSGNLRNKDGKCIPSDQCPSCGGDENAVNGCGTNCGKKCSDLVNPNSVCLLGCILNGCDCKEGFYYDSNKRKCVKKEECNITPQCKGYEVYSSCSNGLCRVQNCEDKGKTRFCPPMAPGSCIPGCVCPEKYLRKNGVCVPEDQCDPPKCTGVEVYSDCSNGLCRVQDCKDKGKSRPCPPMAPGSCIPGCVCPEKYLRLYGVCVPEEQCGNADCSADEEYSECPNRFCSALTCDEVGYTKPNCGKTVPCKGDCICKNGKVKNKDGKCVEPSECPSCGGDSNAQSGCGNFCGGKCSDLLNSSPIACPLMCGMNLCDCKRGFYYDTNIKQCVKPEKCTSVCPADEELSECPNGSCYPLTCDEVGHRKPNCGKKDQCKRGCICKDGKVRNKDGKCVAPKQCPSCGGDPNARSGCGGNCGKKCTDLVNPRHICPLMCILNGCDCKDGFYYDSNTKKCVKAEQCTSVCPADEELSECPNGSCYPLTCDEVGHPKPNCGKKDQCKRGCICKDGKVRNKDGKCVAPSQCPSCGGDPNARSGCGGNCGKKCTDLVNPRRVCALMCILNGCDCKDGFYYDSNTKKCVKAEQCTSMCTNPNEVYDKCPDCSPQTCATKNQKFNCPMIPASKTGANCKPACRCKQGYLRNSKGVCVPVKECEPTCPTGEIYDSCPPVKCDAEYCPKDANSPQTCPTPKKCGKGRCVCGFNSKRDRKTGKCIPIRDCPPFKCNKCNEVYDSCPPVCPGQNCTDYLNKTKCPKYRIGIVVPCKPACRCKQGYYRDSKGNCVSGEKCKDNVCSADEEYLDCPNASCSPLTCNEVGYPKPNCGNSSSVICKPGCVCKNGKVRNKDGKCVPAKECPSCGGDKNAISGCGVNCGKKCSDLIRRNPICPRICRLNACDCKDGFYYDADKKKCVKPNECPSICTKPNEVYDKCPGCSPQTCATRNKIYHCPMIPANKTGPNCKPACRCKPGYFRNSQEVCVPSNECETPTCPNGEIYSSCPPIQCDAEYCPKNRDSPQTCPTPTKCGKGRCVCGFNSKRDRKTGKCIPIRDCPPFACKKCNEIYNSCPPICPGEKCSDFLRNATCSKYHIGIVLPCKPACRCKKGYYRDYKGNCVCGQKCKEEAAIGSNNTTQTTTNTTTQNSCGDVASLKLALIQGSNTFSAKFLKQLMNITPGVSVVTSAASVLTPLAKLALYAEASTYTEISNVLNLKTKEQIRCVYKDFMNSFQTSEGTTLDLADKIYIANRYKPSNSFEQDLNNVFNAKSETVDFNNGNQAADIINQWVSDKTKGKITDLVSPTMFNSLTRLALVNAVYFKGTWKTKFDAKLTQPSDFYVNPNKTVKVDMMKLKTKMNYAYNNDIDAQIIELPYLDGNVTLWVAVPNQRFGLSSLVEKIQDPKVLDTALNSLSSQTVTLHMPKIEVKSTINLKNVLKPIGVDSVFNTNCNISGMITPDEPLYVSEAVQKAFVAINEEGSEAAAANGFMVHMPAMPAPPPPPEPIVIADHPYIYCIRIRGIILFFGIFTG
ncbi:unnamed protein product [Diatraea saccharalis]|uniref:Serpin domain-containing protein n=1 Tax=Diatraea saccharalis TaxID=40085 RepID=A0A9N9QX72_9NEOP|nr:unnamed protein product [Diatraea saccharalis]